MTVRVFAAGHGVEWPAKLRGSQNAREHHMARSRRVKGERSTAAMLCRVSLKRPTLPATITITRVGPRKLDSDNVPGCCKATRDGIADWLGVDDGDDRLTWLYAQAVGAYAVRVEVSGAVNEWDEVLP